MSPERGMELPRTWTLLTVVETNGNHELVPIVIDRFAGQKDDVAEFVITTVANFHTMLEDLRRPIYPFKPGGRRRSKREMSDIAENRTHEINRVEQGLEILTGQRNQAIKLLRDSPDSEIWGFEIFHPNNKEG